MFLEASWIAVYLGQRVIPEGHDMRVDAPPRDYLLQRIEQLHQEIRSTAERMPDHRSMVAKYCPMAA